MSVVRSGEIKALTGLRIVAALWVVLFHFRPLLHQASPPLSEALAPVLDCGAQGVDLFFILSGFVLTWNYLDRMGPTWSFRETLHFLWLRLARVWPVYLVTMHLAALWVVAGGFLSYLRRRLGLLDRLPELRSAVQQIIKEPTRALPSDAYARLFQAGLVHRSDADYQLRYPIYEDYLRRLWSL